MIHKEICAFDSSYHSPSQRVYICLFLCLAEKISKRTIQVMLAGTWLYALLWAVFPLIGWGAYGPEPFGLSCTLAWAEMKEQSPSFVISIFAMNLAIPAIIIVCSYFGIALRLHFTYKTTENANMIQNKVNLQRRLTLVSYKV